MPDPARRASRTSFVPGALVVASQLLFALAAPIAASPSAEYEKAATTILCDCGCHPQSVAACTCGRAVEMRADIRAMIDQGMTGDAVIASYVERYGDKIRIAPTATGFNLLAWLGPFVLLLGGVLAIAWLARRWSRGAGSEAPGAVEAAAPPAGDEAYLARLRREVEERL